MDGGDENNLDFDYYPRKNLNIQSGELDIWCGENWIVP